MEVACCRRFNPRSRTRTYAGNCSGRDHAAPPLRRLLEAGYDPDASVEYYRSGRLEWDIRARSIRATAGEGSQTDEDPPPNQDTTDRKERISAAPTAHSGRCQKPPVAFKAAEQVWDGLTLRLRSSNRELAVLKRDSEYPALFRVHVAPDYVTDLANLTRAKEAAVGLTLAMLNGEVGYRRQRRPRRG
jgi:hypothetical protein